MRAQPDPRITATERAISPGSPLPFRDIPLARKLEAEHAERFQSRWGVEAPNPAEREEHIDVPGFPATRTRVIWPSEKPAERGAGLPIFVLLFGGGFVLGSIDNASWRAQAAEIARAANCIIVLGSYDLAPETRFPVYAEQAAAILDCAVTQAVPLGGDPDRVAIGGASAGANLAAAATLIRRDRGASRIRSQILLVPALNLTMRSTDGRAMPLVQGTVARGLLAWLASRYASRSERRNPYASPLAAHLENLPDAFIVTSEIDPLRGDGERYAQKLMRAGVRTVCIRVSGQTHTSSGLYRFVPGSAFIQQAIVHELRKLHDAPRQWPTAEEVDRGDTAMPRETAKDADDSESAEPDSGKPRSGFGDSTASQEASGFAAASAPQSPSTSTDQASTAGADRASAAHPGIAQWRHLVRQAEAEYPPAPQGDLEAARERGRRVANLVAGRASLPVEAECAPIALEIPTRAGVRSARVYRPASENPPVQLFLHGGGFVFGSPAELVNDSLLSHRAKDTGVMIVSLAYPLAPEHPYPAARDAAMDALDWLRAHAHELGADASRVGIGGNSAGASIVASAAFELSRRGSDAPMHVCLEVPAVSIDALGDAASTRRAERSPDMAEQLAEYPALLEMYAPERDEAAFIADAPSLTGFPPTMIAAAELDILRPGAERLAERLREAGQDVELYIGAGHVHGSPAATAVSSEAREWQDAVAAAMRHGYCTRPEGKA